MTARPKKARKHIAPPGSFGARLREIRLANDLATTRVAAAIDISSTYITQFESGQSAPPSPEILDRLLAAVGASVDEVNELRALAARKQCHHCGQAIPYRPEANHV